MLANLVQGSEHHLTDEALLVLASQHSSAGTKHAASAHLGSCAKCRTRLKETRQIFAAWHHISTRGLLKRQSSTLYGATTKIDDGPAFTWKPLIAILVCCVLFGCLVTFKAIPSVQASSILNQAVRNDGAVGPSAAFQMQFAGETCAKGNGVTDVSDARMSAPCMAGVAMLRKAAWSTRKPFSASAFAAWRNSLPKKKDVVTKQANSVTVDTTAPTGFLREASLTMRTADYLPLTLDLVFEDDAHITLSKVGSTIEEKTATEYAAAAPAAPVPARASHIDAPADPLDVAEVSAWITLDALHADTGWEVTVVRQGGELDVRGTVATPTREQQLLDAFHGEPMVKVEVVHSDQATSADPYRAQRPFGGDSPALAQDWLEQQFPDLDNRSKFANNALDLSKTVLGRAFFLSQLKQSRSSMPPSAAAEKLSELIARKQSSLVASQSALAAVIRPLVGDPKRPANKPLSYDDARKLDAALGSLLAASGQGASSYDAQLELVRNLL